MARDRLALMPVLAAMDPLSATVWLLALAAGALGFFLPGWLLTRVVVSPVPVLSAFLGSIVLLFEGVLLLDAFHLPITALSLSTWLLIVSIPLVWLARRRAAQPAPDSVARSSVFPAYSAGKWMLAIAIALGALVLRAFLDPLSGWDTYFRWDRIAHLLLETASLEAYPAVSTRDFTLYAWPEGIPPLLPILHFWIYSATGSEAPELTTLVVTVVATLLFALTGRFARELWRNAEAGWISAAMLGTSALTGWSLAMGQETGLTALTLLAMLYFIHRYRQERHEADAIWAGVAAAAGALSRDYCLIYLVVGGCLFVCSREGRRAFLIFLGTAVLIAAPWYVRNAWITGNPLYSHDLAGLFPVSEALTTWMRIGGSFTGFSAETGSGLRTLLFLGVVSGPLLIVGGYGLLQRRLALRGALIAAAAVVTLLWLWSVHQTFGGIAYSTESSHQFLPSAQLAQAGLGHSLPREPVGWSPRSSCC